MMDLALLGTGGMMPLPNRYLSSFICRYNGKTMIIDCGEGTQVSLRILGWGYKNIDAICFTHFHADHITGLPGLLIAISNAGRTEDVSLYGPPDLARMVAGLLVVAPELGYNVVCHELPYKDHTDIHVEGTEFFINTQRLAHGRPCFGYAIETKRLGKFDLERAKKLDIPVQLWSKLQKSGPVEHEGRLYTPDMVMGEPRKGFKVCFCTDTRPTKKIPAFVNGADLFICEGMYGDEERRETAKSHMHMLFSEAAGLARDGNVKKLWLTHYSPALINPKEFINNARVVFPESYAGYDRMTTTLAFDD